MNLGIRKAEINDAEALASLTEELGYYSTEEEIKNKLAGISVNPRQAVFTAETDKVKSWMHLALAEPLESVPFAGIQGIVVKEEFRGKGVGTKMFQTAGQWTRDKGYKSIRIRTNITRKEARELYKRLGFISKKTQEVFEKEI